MLNAKSTPSAKTAKLVPLPVYSVRLKFSDVILLYNRRFFLGFRPLAGVHVKTDVFTAGYFHVV